MFKFINSILGFIDRLFNKHKLVRRSIVVWAIWAVSYTLIAILDPKGGDSILLHMTTSGASVVIAIIGILTTAIGYYKYSRDKEITKEGDQ